jgi:hypothetical protein
MAKKTRKRVAAKAAKTSKAASKTKGAKTKGAETKGAVTKKRRKVAAGKKSKPVAKKKVPGKEIHPSLLKNIEDKVADAFTAVVDTLADAERLHHQLDPGVSREPE